jgi:hypothetical protein
MEEMRGIMHLTEASVFAYGGSGLLGEERKK